MRFSVFPASIFAVFMLAAADHANANFKRDQICEAHFFGGQWALLQNAKEEAIRLFRLAASDCPRILVAWIDANLELKALGAAKP